MAIRARIFPAMAVVLPLMLTACSVDGGGETRREPTVTPVPRPTATAVPLRAGPAQDTADPGATPAAGVLPAGGAVGAPLSAVEVVDRVRPAVVTVVNEQRVGGFGSDEAQEAGRGTGFIIDEQGHIVTNWHVVAGGDRFEVIFADGEKRPAELVGADQLSDLAVVRIDDPVPATVPFGDSDALRPGQPVLAIGSPLGEFTSTVTDGIVSALGRDLPGSPAQGDPSYSNLIQHNAAINPGNSGGPLFDLSGQVVGVNTLGIPQTSQGVPAQGLFFAIPSNTVKRITTQLIEQGRVAYPYLGVEVVDITPEIASQNDLPFDYGAYIARVGRDGPAEEAGIREGDFILAIGDHPIDEQSSFTEALFNYQPGDTVGVTVRRGDEEERLNVTLAERPPQ